VKRRRRSRSLKKAAEAGSTYSSIVFGVFLFVFRFPFVPVTFEETGLGNYRGRLDIIADILRVASQNAKKTQIMYQANLSYKVLQRYLRDITEASLLRFESAEQHYVVTLKGQEFLEAYKDYAKTNRSIERRLNAVDVIKKSLEELCSSK
jgi:predicted transcriptional regulator